MEQGKQILVVFCGAGFSVGAGLPTMLSFSHAVRTCKLLDESEKLDFERIQIACSGMTAMTGASSRNLEDIASLLSVLKLAQPAFRFSECKLYTTPDAALALLDHCIRCVFSPANHDYFQRSALLLSQVASVSNLSLITTNYDMHIEIGAATLGVAIGTSTWQSECLATKQWPSHNLCSIYKSTYITDSASTEWKFNLFKLHGSVNWFAGSPVRVEDRWFVDKRQANGQPEVYRLGVTGLDDEPAAKRLLVPPAVIKPEGFSQLAQEWQGASAALGKADAIWFIGYSFPQSDAFMRYFLAGALQANTRLQQIAIIDPCAAEIAERTQDLFGSAEFSGLVEPIPMKWEDFSRHMPLFLARKWTPSADDYQFQQLRQQQEGRAILRGAMLPQQERITQTPRGRSRDRGWPLR